MTIQSYVDEYHALAGEAPDWLKPIRRAAIDRFRTLGFPTRRNEDWHFTSVAPIADGHFTPLGNVERSALARGASAARRPVRIVDIEPFLFDRPDWPRIVFVNGRFAPDLSPDIVDHAPGRASAAPGRRARFEISTLAAALDADIPGVRRNLTTVASIEQSAFTALNSALFTDGAFVRLPTAELELPIHLLFVSDAGAAHGVAYPRTLVLAEPHARATIIESYVALDDTSNFTNAVTELRIAEGAEVAHVRIQRESRRGFHVGTVEAHQARDSRYSSFSFVSGASLSRVNVYTTLAGPGAGATLDGLYLADGTQHLDQQTRIVHQAPNCTSHEVYTGILDGAAHGVFNGKVYVHPEAQKTDGKQTNNNLLLSPEAHADTKPQLEIFADDVKCTHGATVGRLDETAMFYLRSRGLPAGEARTLLTYAFAAEVLERITEPAVRGGLERLVRERFVGAPDLALA